MAHKKETFLDLLEHYFGTYLPTVRGLSESTVVSYKATFRILFEFLYTQKSIPSDKVTLELLDDEVITEFLDWLELKRNCSIATRNQRLSAIAAFSIYVQNHDFCSGVSFRNNVTKVPKKKSARPGRSFFSREEVRILFQLPDAATEIGLRDKTLLCFMYASGTRAQEVCDLTVGDIQFYPDRAGINVHGKGKKVRRIGIPSGAAIMLQKYIRRRKISDCGNAHVFSSQTHEKMTVSCIEEIFAKYVARAKNENPGMFRNNYTPHSMRHTTATHMLEAGIPLVVVKNFLGHVSLQTTQIYAEVTQDTMNQQLQEWNKKWFVKDDLGGAAGKGFDNTPSFLK